MKNYVIRFDNLPKAVQQEYWVKVQEKAFRLGVYIITQQRLFSYLHILHADAVNMYIMTPTNNTDMVQYDIPISIDDFLSLPEFTKGDIILCRDHEEEPWLMDVFERSYDDGEYPLRGVRCGWRYCIPYKGNEHLYV